MKQPDAVHFCRCPLGISLKGNSQTGHWGYWYDLLEPAMVVVNDSVIAVEMPTFESGSACKAPVAIWLHLARVLMLGQH